MCGRYTQTTASERVLFRFGLETSTPQLSARYNIAPGQVAPVIVNDTGKAMRLMQWGLVPSWAKEPSIGNKMINARAETITEKPSFKRLLGKRRCLVVADGFYEWAREGKGKIPMRFVLKTREPFGIAGLWDVWRKPDGDELQSFTIITTEANDLLRPIHERMPVILHKDDENRWLDLHVRDFGELRPLLGPYPAKEMEAYVVSKIVNSPTHDILQCIQPVS